MQLTNALAAALASLDPTDDGHWTNDGQARVDVVNAELAKMDAETVTRQDIIDGAPLFTREAAPAMQAEYRATAGPLDPLTPATPAPAAPAAPTAAPAPQTPPPSDHSLPPLGGDTRPPAPPTAPPTLANVKLDPTPKVPEGLLGEMEGSALDVPLHELMRSVPMLEAAVAEINITSAAIVAERTALAEKLKELYAKSELCVRQLGRIKPKDDPTDGVRSYLAASAKAREERARRAQVFVKAGTTANDVAAQMRTGSALDAALSQRRPVPGSTRPSVRIPVGG